MKPEIDLKKLFGEVDKSTEPKAAAGNFLLNPLAHQNTIQEDELESQCSKYSKPGKKVPASKNLGEMPKTAGVGKASAAAKNGLRELTNPSFKESEILTSNMSDLNKSSQLVPSAQ